MKKKVKKDVKVISKKKNKVVLKKKVEKEIEGNENDLNIHNENENYGRIKWSLQVVDIDKLKPYEKNPRTITEEALNELASSFNEIGMCQPLVVSHDYSIISGNARYLQLKKEGCDKVQVMIPDRRLTEKQEKAVVIRMNKTVVGKWDYDVLANNYEVIDLMDWGFTTEELIGVDEEKIEPKCDEDEVPEVKDTVTKRGDIWLLGNHRVCCGDSTMIDDVEKLMKGEKADMVFTSPPYNIGKNGFEEKGKYENDKDDKENYREFLGEFHRAWIGKCGYMFINLQSVSSNKIAIIEWLWDFKEYFVDSIACIKDTTLPAMEKNILNSDYEMVYVFGDSNRTRHIKIGKEFRGSVPNVVTMKRNRNKETKEHRAGFDISFPLALIESLTCKGVSVADPFMGTGTTLIACEKTNRKCYGMELDEHYCDVIVQRWQKYTGKEAILESTGEKYNNLIK